MPQWSRIIQYRDFYDVPRMFLVRHEGRLLLFDCRFDDLSDDYEGTYRVYEMPDMPEQNLSDSWQDLAIRAGRCLGSVKTSAVHFDSTKRAEIDLRILEDLDGTSTDPTAGDQET